MSHGEDNNRTHPEVAAFVNEFLEYKLRQNGYQWSCPPPATQEAERTIAARAGQALKTLADEFAMKYKDSFVELCEKLELSETSMKPTIVGIANELFSEGIKWARIVAFFVFSGELAIYCKDKNVPQFINLIAINLSSYISEKLLPWINDHGGWDGLITFNDGRDPEQPNNLTWPSVKNLLCIGISALGALSLGALLSKS